MFIADTPHADGSWPDDNDPDRRWALPAGVALGSDPDGAPRFLLARWAGEGARGGLLHFELDTQPPTIPLATTVPWTAARARVVVRAVDDAPVGGWHDLPPAAVPLVTVSDQLSINAVQQLDAGLRSAGPVIAVDVEAQARGVAGALAALVTLDLDRVSPLLPAGPWTVDELGVALLNLPEDALTVVPFEVGIPRANVAVELAHRLIADLDSDHATHDTWTPTRYQLPDPLPGYVLAYDLRSRRPAVVTFRTSWSATGWAEGLDDAQRAAAFPRLDGVSAFGMAPVLVVAAVPLDTTAGVRSVEVDVMTTGIGGLPERRSFVFDGTGPSVARFTTVHPTWWGPLPAPTAQASAVVAGAGGARLVGPFPLAASGTLVTATPADLGLAVTTVDAESGVFEIAPEVVVTVGDAVATLIDQTPAHLAHAATDDALLEVTVGGTVVLTVPATDRFTLTTADLLTTDPDLVQVCLDDPRARSTFTAVTVLGPLGNQRTLVLDATSPLTWPCRRRSKVDPLSYRWRMDWIPRAADGSTAPMVATDWVDGHDTTLTVTITEDS